MGIDLDGDRLFDRLLIFDADLLIGGYYGLTADLRTAQFARLLSQIEALPLNKGLKQSLAVKLQGAQRALEKNHHNSIQAATNRIKAFINEVQAQRGVHVPRTMRTCCSTAQI